MKRYRVTLRTEAGLATRMASTNVPAESPADAVAKAAMLLLGGAGAEVGQMTRKGSDYWTGTVRASATMSDYWSGDVSSVWAYEAQMEPLSEAFNVSGLVRMGHIAGPITPRGDRGADACAA